MAHFAGSGKQPPWATLRAMTTLARVRRALRNGRADRIRQPPRRPFPASQRHLRSRLEKPVGPKVLGSRRPPHLARTGLSQRVQRLGSPCHQSGTSSEYSDGSQRSGPSGGELVGKGRVWRHERLLTIAIRRQGDVRTSGADLDGDAAHPLEGLRRSRLDDARKDWRASPRSHLHPGRSAGSDYNVVACRGERIAGCVLPQSTLDKERGRTRN